MLLGLLLGAATLGLYGAAEARRLRTVPLLPAVAVGLDVVVDADGAVRTAPAAAHIVVLGDSVAAGTGAGAVDGSFPHALAACVAAAVGNPVRVRSLGVSGARIADVLRDQIPGLADADGQMPDVAVLSVGVNDVTHLTPPRRFASDLEAALRACRAAGVQPVVTGLPDFRALAVLSPALRHAGYQLGERIHRLQRVTAERVAGARFVDVKAAVGARFRADPSLLAEDRFHPSAAGCACLAGAVVSAVADALADDPLTGSP